MTDFDLTIIKTVLEHQKDTIEDVVVINEGMSNGDVIKAMFPNTEVDDYDYGKDPVIDVYGIDDTEYITLRKNWWNSLYQKGDKE